MSTHSDDFDRAIAHALACTVEIRTSSGTGAGCILHPDGLVATGRHVVNLEDGSSLKQVQVVLNPGTENETIINGTIFYSHRKLDLALLWLNKEGIYPAIPIGDPKEIKHAQTVYAIGSPGNLANTLSKGIVSNPRGRFNDVECIQTDAAIDFGNSGGPLINERGELLGINLWGLGQFDAAKFAVPVDYIQDVIDQAVKAGRQKCLEAYYCPLCGFNDPQSNHLFCRNCGSTIQAESKQFPPARKVELEGGKEERLLERIMKIFQAFNSVPEQIVQVWISDLPDKGHPGFMSAVKTKSGAFILVGSAPVMLLPYKGTTLSMDEVILLTSSVGEIPQSHFVFSNDTISMMICADDDNLNEDNVTAVIDNSIKVFAGVSEDLHKSFDILFAGETKPEGGSEPGSGRQFPQPKLPNIRLTPNEMQVVSSVMGNTDAHGQETYKFILEKWQKAGFTVTTTSQMIVLDAPYGNRTARIAMFLPPQAQGKALIGLFWGALRKHTGFPKEGVDKYQDAIQKLFTLRTTQSVAYFEVDERITTKEINSLVKEMTRLAASVVKDGIEPPTKPGPATSDNIKTTLETCSESAREIFSLLIGGWNAAGGTVQCARPGRIYLKMRTKAHQTGREATVPRNFSLVVLAAPKGKTPEHIAVTQGLADAESGVAYLDCIPEEVAAFDAATSALPGFEQHGTIERILLGKAFTLKHAKELMKQMLTLKLAEEKAP